MTRIDTANWPSMMYALLFRKLKLKLIADHLPQSFEMILFYSPVMTCM